MAISKDALRRLAVKKAQAMTEQGKDWQEIQFDLINDDGFASLFEGMDDDETYDATMQIIRAGEEACEDMN